MTNPTPDQTAKLLAELSASGSTKINASTEGHPMPDMSLRGAVSGAYWKTNALLPLANRPTDINTWDDQYGHVLSLRAEHLVTQAILGNLAAKLGVNVDQIRNDVLKGLNS